MLLRCARCDHIYSSNLILKCPSCGCREESPIPIVDNGILLRHPDVDEVFRAPESIESVAADAFQGNQKLRRVELPYGVKRIGDGAFALSSVKEINLPNSIESVGRGAFAWTKLSTIRIPESVERLGDGVFYECCDLKGVFMNAAVDKLEDFMFYGCSELETAVLPSSIKSIGKQAFYNCQKLESASRSIELPILLESVGDYAFWNCFAKKMVCLPDSLVDVGKYAFGGSFEREDSPIVVMNEHDLPKEGFVRCQTEKRRS